MYLLLKCVWNLNQSENSPDQKSIRSVYQLMKLCNEELGGNFEIFANANFLEMKCGIKFDLKTYVQSFN